MKKAVVNQLHELRPNDITSALVTVQCSDDLNDPAKVFLNICSDNI
jgi:hypothetical protein